MFYLTAQALSNYIRCEYVHNGLRKSIEKIKKKDGNRISVYKKGADFTLGVSERVDISVAQVIQKALRGGPWGLRCWRIIIAVKKIQNCGDLKSCGVR